MKQKMHKKLKSWHTCRDCGLKAFPQADFNKMVGITVTGGDCPDCGKKNVTLIPISDFKYASGSDAHWD